VVLASELFLFLAVAGATAPEILHEPLPCVAPGRNPVVDAVIPGADIRTAKVYFRSDKYPKFYYVEMKPTAAALAYSVSCRNRAPRPRASSTTSKPST